MNSLFFFLRYARLRYLLYRILLRIKVGKDRRNAFLSARGISPIDFLPERPYSTGSVKVIPRRGSFDYYMFFMSREADVQEHLVMHNNETFLDVGANIGSYALRIAKKYRNIGVRVIAIEAHPDNYDALCRNIRCNKLNNIEAVNKAATEYRGAVRMYERLHSGKRVGSDLYSLCDTFLHPNNIVKNDGKIIEVECDEIDSILASHGKVQVMKMDIEGAEVSALKGASKTLGQLRKVIVEIHGNTLEPVIDILKSHGFEIFVTNAEMNHVIGTKKWIV
jgi:FkbM family methyltransferase